MSDRDLERWQRFLNGTGLKGPFKIISYTPWWKMRLLNWRTRIRIWWHGGQQR